jgi:hypothetical protein
MDDTYEPASDFLKAVVANEVPLSGSDFAEENLKRLIELTRDDDLTNRDWATMLLAQEELDTPELRAALLVAAFDENEVVRAEALLGLAKRDTALALPFAEVALAGERASMAVFEAAALIADPSLVEALQAWTVPSEHGLLDQVAAEALTACQNGRPA